MTSPIQPDSTPPDPSNGYDALAEQFIASRSETIGVDLLAAWVRSLPSGAEVLDLGCGHGVPVTRLLLAQGRTVFAVDASPRLVAAFRERFPGVAVECAAAESSRWFDRPFDAIVAWGLLFLLPPATQLAILRRAAEALRPGGALLFTSPAQPCAWNDSLTGRRSVSLGSAAYRSALEASGLKLDREADDAGGNHTYFASRPGPTERPRRL